jgi:hypothetical protein
MKKNKLKFAMLFILWRLAPSYGINKKPPCEVHVKN